MISLVIVFIKLSLKFVYRSGTKVTQLICTLYTHIVRDGNINFNILLYMQTKAIISLSVMQ